MVRRNTIVGKLKLFKKKLNKDIPIETMVLFGSRARGKTGKDTDVDLIIVSSKFRTLDFFKRGAKMYDYWDLRYPVDFLCYSPEEFKKLKKGVTIVKQALEEGIVI
ncbi:MAG TPA: nucleotidyltransferase domain-containing protein [archaeon]|nr:nucleotidyltransferase domain-containing protein [archaeon]